MLHYISMLTCTWVCLYMYLWVHVRNSCLKSLSLTNSIGGWVQDVSFSANGELLAFVGHDSSISVVNGANQQQWVITDHAGFIFSASFNGLNTIDFGVPVFCFRSVNLYLWIHTSQRLQFFAQVKRSFIENKGVRFDYCHVTWKGGWGIRNIMLKFIWCCIITCPVNAMGCGKFGRIRVWACLHADFEINLDISLI